jgi:hypothetical protein
MTEETKPIIVCAAIKNTIAGAIIPSARHYDILMRTLKGELDNNFGVDTPSSDWEQGFIDQFGKFYNRKDAMKVVKESGQPFNAERNSGSGEELYSEGLY